mmetsp:Transcript_75904/g.205218  ORF Transcript_75904/g.205218 Transcript_75904/m.205218 type:complete len:275 (-) Transcript_75904:1363-2187(-)
MQPWDMHPQAWSQVLLMLAEVHVRTVHVEDELSRGLASACRRARSELLTSLIFGNVLVRVVHVKEELELIAVFPWALLAACRACGRGALPLSPIAFQTKRPTPTPARKQHNADEHAPETTPYSNDDDDEHARGRTLTFVWLCRDGMNVVNHNRVECQHGNRVHGLPKVRVDVLLQQGRERTDAHAIQGRLRVVNTERLSIDIRGHVYAVPHLEDAPGEPTGGGPEPPRSLREPDGDIARWHAHDLGDRDADRDQQLLRLRPAPNGVWVREPKLD